nr:MAG TPA: hypothetical protein [Caudoviricetes sp.]
MKFGKSAMPEKSLVADAAMGATPENAASVATAGADGIPVLDEVLAERGARYGSFGANAAIVQRIKRAMRSADGWDRLTDVQREGLEMMAGKIGRMLSGDPTYLDNGVDLAGYARLVLEDMQRAERARKDRTLALRTFAERGR